ncbi:PREDICTED: odorant receptor 9a-like [Eufriesea mexicana]|uniref:odorant receptor 9a-like n=1 Tax=Eufriesea mexicana TaxID=516756 RepID=UPI00083C55E5|nr:PREDICTED: odorant receptor 9a-like [Eufriesea mexicana]
MIRVIPHIFVSQKHTVFQENNKRDYNALNITQYRTLKQYLTICGINPYQSDRMSNIIVITMVLYIISMVIPSSLQLYGDILKKDLDCIIQNIPHLVTGMVSIIKILNIRSNKTQFRKIFDSVAEHWKLLEAKNELYMLNKFTGYGITLANIYRRTLLTCLIIFFSLPFYNPLLDFVSPLNETRPRQHIFKVNYLTLDVFEHYYGVYVHLSCSALVIVVIIVSVDSLHIIITYHTCGLFAVCGSQVQKTAENNTITKDGVMTNDVGYEEFKECVIWHHKVLQFYHLLAKCCRNLYLVQMGLNMIVIISTAVEIVMFLNKPEEAIRASVFLMAQQFHLYVISLPGQDLLEQSLELADKIYSSDWYQIPMKCQKVFYMMQIRSNKPCIMTAAGLYEMKIESFGITVKACMSYFTMFLSLRQ